MEKVRVCVDCNNVVGSAARCGICYSDKIVEFTLVCANGHFAHEGERCEICWEQGMFMYLLPVDDYTRRLLPCVFK